MKMKAMIALAGVLMAAGAQAQYKCVEGGKVSFSDVPCETTLKPAERTEEIKIRKAALAKQRQSDSDERGRIQREFDIESATKSAECEAWLATTPVVRNAGSTARVAQVEQYLKTVFLKDPDSLVVEQWGDVRRDCSGYVIAVKFRARNGFGGYVKEARVFSLDRDGNVIAYK